MEVTREVVLEAPVEEVWDALTDPEQLEEWFANDVELDARARRRRRLPLGRRRGAPRGRRGGRSPSAASRSPGTTRAASRSSSRRSRAARACSSPRPPAPAGARASLLLRALALRARLSDIFDALARPDTPPPRRGAGAAGGLGDPARLRAAGDAAGGGEAPGRAAGRRTRRLAQAAAARRSTSSTRRRSTQAVAWIASVGGEWDARLERLRGHLQAPRRD